MVKFANIISRTLSAPRGWQLGQPLSFIHPPAPQAEELRHSKFAEYNAQVAREEAALKSFDVPTSKEYMNSDELLSAFQEQQSESRQLMDKLEASDAAVEVSEAKPIVFNSVAPSKKRMLTLDFGFGDDDN